jgi:hypothetical protein
MPHNGEVNLEFGVYRNTCCSAEILIPEDVTFPQCAKHGATEWKDITDVEYTTDVESTTDHSSVESISVAKRIPRK